MKPLPRSLSDAYSSLRRRFGKPPQVCLADDPSVREKALRVQEAGTLEFDNSADFRMGGVPLEKLPYSWPENHLFRMRNAFVAGDQGFVFLEDGRVFEPSFRPYRIDQIKLRYPWPVTKKIPGGPVLHLTGNNHENRGHYMQDHLPRLLAAERALGSLQGLRVLVAPGHRRWQVNFLKPLGIPEENILEGSHSATCVEDLLFVPITASPAGFADPELYRIFQKRMQPQAAGYDLKPRVLFLSRRDAPDRRLSNETELLDITRKMLGETDVAVLSKLKLPQQIAAYSAADIIISPTGQAVTNVLMVNGKKVAVLLPGDRETAYEKWAYSFLSFLGGNTPMMFYANTPVRETRPIEWEFPSARYRELLQRGLDLQLFDPA